MRARVEAEREVRARDRRAEMVGLDARVDLNPAVGGVADAVNLDARALHVLDELRALRTQEPAPHFELLVGQDFGPKVKADGAEELSLVGGLAEAVAFAHAPLGVERLHGRERETV